MRAVGLRRRQEEVSGKRPVQPPGACVSTGRNRSVVERQLRLPHLLRSAQGFEAQRVRLHFERHRVVGDTQNRLGPVARNPGRWLRATGAGFQTANEHQLLWRKLIRLLKVTVGVVESRGLLARNEVRSRLDDAAILGESVLRLVLRLAVTVVAVHVQSVVVPQHLLDLLRVHLLELLRVPRPANNKSPYGKISLRAPEGHVLHL